MESDHADHADHGDRDDHDDFGGLQRDLPRLLGRRRAMQVLGGVGLAGLVAACSGGNASNGSSTVVGQGTGSTSVSTSSGGSAVTASTATASTTASSTSTDGTVTTAGTASAGDEIPSETQGPYPADGSNGPNLLTTDGIVRHDIRSSIGDLSGSADGVPMTLQLTLVDSATGSPLTDHAIYAWHCTADGAYSIYEVSDQNYLRGVQVTDASGKLSFTSIFPGCYAGRWPHVHFEIYGSAGAATSGDNAIKTSQLAFAQADCEAVYADARYGSSADNLARLSLTSDNVFSDGWESQLATASGDNANGYTVSLLVRV